MQDNNSDRKKQISWLLLVGFTLILLGLDFSAMSGTADYASGQGYKHLRIEAKTQVL